ncbi:hypothetical protein TrVE_jg5571 [Triparma verrucosa]|uniref:Uncharacterized protein n=1 Tax=Triparma verrucosa TaxID=1606542 RepID=A0A9W7EM28_9STRA|nr:hypothetical protein TrVE_jg5571 [Triparma verrucosa]
MSSIKSFLNRPHPSSIPSSISAFALAALATSSLFYLYSEKLLTRESYESRRTQIDEEYRPKVNQIYEEMKQVNDVDEIEEIVEKMKEFHLYVSGKNNEGYVVFDSKHKVALKFLNPLINSVLTSKISSTSYLFTMSTLP